MVLHPVVLLWSMSSFIEASCRETAQYSIFTSLFGFGDTRRLDSPERKAASVGPRQRSRASGASGGATLARLERNDVKLAIVFFCGFFQCPNDVPSFFLDFLGRLCGYSCGVLHLPKAAGAILCKNPMSQRCPRPRPRPNFASIAW